MSSFQLSLAVLVRYRTLVLFRVRSQSSYIQTSNPGSPTHWRTPYQLNLRDYHPLW